MPKPRSEVLDYTYACAGPMHVGAIVFHSRLVYRLSNKDYGYCVSAGRPLDGTFNFIQLEDVIFKTVTGKHDCKQLLFNLGVIIMFPLGLGLLMHMPLAALFAKELLPDHSVTQRTEESLCPAVKHWCAGCSMFQGMKYILLGMIPLPLYLF